MIIILNGSPDIDGNSAHLAKVSQKIIEEKGLEAKIINVIEILKDMDVPFCTACTNPCKAVCSRGNKLGESFEVLKKAKGLIMISPVYFGSVSGELKAYWDLLRYLRYDKVFYNMPGGAAAIGASRFGGQETAIKAMHDMMLVQGMVIAGDGYHDNMGHQGAAFKRPAAEDSDGLKSLARLSNRIAELSKIIYR